MPVGFPPKTPLGLGCEALGGADWGTVDIHSVRDAVRCALDGGVTVFDTADVYGLGRSEEELARVLGGDRHRVTIVTKGGIRWAAQSGEHRARTFTDASAVYLESALNNSLRRLRLDAISLYLVHRHDVQVPETETLEFLERARVAGKVLSYGVSNWPMSVVRTVRATAAIASLELELSLLSPDSVLRELDEARGLNLTTLTYGPLAQGLLSGKYRAESSFDVTDRRHRLDRFSREAYTSNRQVLDALAEVAREVGRTQSQVAIRWAIDTGVVTAVIFGAKSPAQVLDNLSAMSCTLDASHLRKLQTAREQVGLTRV